MTVTRRGAGGRTCSAGCSAPAPMPRRTGGDRAARVGEVVDPSSVGIYSSGPVEPNYGRWLTGAVSAGGCAAAGAAAAGAASGPTPRRASWCPQSASWPDAPDGVVYKPCGDRRASVCPPCAERYRQDTWQVIAAGLRGGKGVPAEVAGHPAVFLTLTAPSFGLVHSRRTTRTGRVLPCRPRRKPAPCPHGVELSCSRRHDEGEAVLGLPLCLDCYDHAGQVVWNAHVGELWRRTIIGLRRGAGPRRSRPRRGRPALVRQGRGVPAPRRRPPARAPAARRRRPGRPGRDHPAGRRGRGRPGGRRSGYAAADRVRHGCAPTCGRTAGGSAGASSSTSGRCGSAATATSVTGPSSPTSPSTPPSRPRAPATSPSGSRRRQWTTTPIRRRMPVGSSTPAGRSAALRAGTGCGGGLTCSASAATSARGPAGTPPLCGRSELLAGPGAGGSWSRAGTTREDTTLVVGVLGLRRHRLADERGRAARDRLLRPGRGSDGGSPARSWQSQERRHIA